MTQPDRDNLEALITGCGIYDVLSHIASICADKAEHISANRQDNRLAKVWETVDEKLGPVLVYLENKEI